MHIRPAIPPDFPAIMGLVQSCVRSLQTQGIDQWDDLYPDQATLRRDLDRRELYLLEIQGAPGGIMVLNEHQPPEYRNVVWQYSGRALVVHRLAVDPTRQRQGLAKRLMRFAYDFAGEQDYQTIRLDAFVHNPASNALYAKLGYRRTGTVVFRKGPFNCYEIRVDSTQ